MHLIGHNEGYFSNTGYIRFELLIDFQSVITCQNDTIYGHLENESDGVMATCWACVLHVQYNYSDNNTKTFPNLLINIGRV
jgi:hypothetical protein